MKIKNVFYIGLFALLESQAPPKAAQAQPIMCHSMGIPKKGEQYELNLDSNFTNTSDYMAKPQVINDIFFIINIEGDLEYADVKHLRTMNRIAQRINNPIRFLASVEGKVICYI